MGILILVSLFWASSVQADSVFWSGTIDPGDGIINVDTAVFDAPYNPLFDRYYFEAQPFTVDVSGGYQIQMLSASFAFCGDDGVFALYAGGFSASSPQANRIAANDDFSGGSFLPGLDVNLTAGTLYILVTSTFCEEDTGSYTNSISGPGVVSLSVPGGFNPGDNRINATDKDRAAPVAIYCTADGIMILRIDPVTARGIDPAAVDITTDEIEAVGVSESDNLLLGDNAGVQLWRLTDGKFQVNTVYPLEPGKPYIVNWHNCDRSTLLHLAS
ncbi:MAG: hypothetical protein JNM70_18010 [Anaerolineae bacterium]|nr:hypothetical protein [Anaerolineae bacterium]